MTGQLRIADDLLLPLDAVTETFAILAKRGAGKTYTASVLVEEMMGSGQPVIVLDPLGVWWGLRSSADGQGEGLPVVIFGGEHADLPLHETAGHRIADVLIERRSPAVLDLSDLSKSAARRFVADFLERLYHANRHPLHLVIDEADMFAPQRTDAGGARLLGTMQDVQRRGRSRGIGTTVISQRPAVLNKDILTQAEVLIVLRMAGVRDVAAIDEWVRLHADDDQARQVKDSLPGLPVGTAWVWSAGWLQILQRVQVRRRRTFDSSATPKVGEVRVVAERMAAVDLAALADLLAVDETTEAPADAVKLRREIAVLQRRLAEATAAPREVPVLTDDDRVALRQLVEQAEHAAASARELRDDVLARLASPAAPALRQAPLPAAAALSDTAPAQSENGNGGGPLKPGAGKMLDVAARHYPLTLTRAQLGTLAGIAPRGGTFSTYYSALRRRDLIVETGGRLAATEAGLAVAGVQPGNPVTVDEVRERWRGVLKAGARAMLDHLIDIYPDWTSRTELATAAGIAAAGGTYSTYLSILRSNGLAVVNGKQVRADEVLFTAPTAAGTR